MFWKILSYPRSIVSTLFAVVFTGFYSAVAVIGTFIVPGYGFQNFILYSWAKILCAAFNIQVTVKGLENLSPDGVLFVFNHTSHFDIPAFHAAIRKTTRFGAKIELYKIPFFGSAMRAFGALPITRSDRDKVFKLYQESIERVYKGLSYILAAEGGRHTGRGVGEKFKSGPFIFAINGQFPIQPLVIKGAGEILPKTGWLPSWGRWTNPVTITVLPPVRTAGLTLENRESLKQSIHEMMTKAYAQS